MTDANIDKSGSAYRYEVSPLAKGASYLLLVRGAHADPASVAKTGPLSGSAGYDVRGISISQQAPVAMARCESKTYKVELTENITVSINDAR